jgi:hypothetical protein
MRVTVELPDALMRRVKVQAAMTDRKIKAFVAELLELGLEADALRGGGGKAPTQRSARRAATTTTGRRSRR